MGLGEDLAALAGAAQAFAAPGEELAGVLVAESGPAARTYVCAFAGAGPERSWLALDEDGQPVGDRARVRAAVSIAAMCEVAEETAAGGDLEELRVQLVSLRITENPPGIDEAEEATLALERVLAPPPRVASPAYLDAVGLATVRLEQALGQAGPSPFAEAMKEAVAAVEALTAEVEAGYKSGLE